MSEINSGQNINVARSLGIDHKTIRGKRWKKWILIGCTAFVVIIIAFIFFNKSQKGAEALIYDTKETQKGELTIIVTATGNLEPTNEIDVGIEVSGTVNTVEVDYNDRVVIGQVLARLDTSKLEAQVLQSKSGLESAKTNVTKAEAEAKKTKSELDRLLHVQELSGGKVPAQTDIDVAEAAYQSAVAELASAKASVSQAQANLSLQQTDLSKAVIKSPVNGIVMDREIEPGQTVAASFQSPTLFTLAEDLTKMELHVDVDEADVGKVKEGQDATFTVDAYPDRKYNAKVISVRYASGEVSGVITYETVLDVDNSDLSLRPGMTATADIIVQKVENAVLVPNAALRFTPPVTEKTTTKSAKKDSSGLVGTLLPHPPRNSETEKVAVNNSVNQKAWILIDGKPLGVDITVGVTDGALTEVVSGDLKPGQQVIVDSRSKTK